jgi:hypothetical protein
MASALRIGRDAWSHVARFLSPYDMTHGLAPVCRDFRAAVDFGGLKQISKLTIGPGQLESLAGKVARMGKLALTIGWKEVWDGPAPRFPIGCLSSLSVSATPRFEINCPGKTVIALLNQTEQVEQLTVCDTGSHEDRWLSLGWEGAVNERALQSLRHLRISDTWFDQQGFANLLRGAPGLVLVELHFLGAIEDVVFQALAGLGRLETCMLNHVSPAHWNTLVAEGTPFSRNRELRRFRCDNDMSLEQLRTFVEQHPFITHLDISSLMIGRDTVAIEIVSHLKQLQSIHANIWQMEVNGAKTLLQKCPDLTSVNFGGDKPLPVIQALLEDRNLRWRRLNLSAYSFSDEVWAKLGTCVNLVELELYMTELEVGKVCEVVQKMPKLQKLVLNGPQRLDDRLFDTLAEHCKELRSLYVYVKSVCHNVTAAAQKSVESLPHFESLTLRCHRVR